jgi:hypothetical protein
MPSVMSLLLRATLMLPVAAVSLSCQQPAASAAPIRSITLPPAVDRVLRDYEKAWAARDAAALAALFTADGMLLRPGEAPVRGRDAIRQAYDGAGGPLALRAFAYAISDSVGWILGGFAPTPGAPDVGKFTLTLLRAPDGRWLIASDMDNPNDRRR